MYPSNSLVGPTHGYVELDTVSTRGFSRCPATTSRKMVDVKPRSLNGAPSSSSSPQWPSLKHGDPCFHFDANTLATNA